MAVLEFVVRLVSFYHFAVFLFYSSKVTQSARVFVVANLFYYTERVWSASKLNSNLILSEAIYTELKAAAQLINSSNGKLPAHFVSGPEPSAPVTYNFDK